MAENLSGTDLTDIPHFMCGKIPVDPEGSAFEVSDASALDEVQRWNVQIEELLEQLEEEMPVFVVSEYLLGKANVRPLNISTSRLNLRRVRNTAIPCLVIQNS